MQDPGPWSRKVIALTDIRRFVSDHGDELTTTERGAIYLFLDKLTVESWDPPATYEDRVQLESLG